MFLKCMGFCRNSNHTSSSQTQRGYPTVIEDLCHHFSLPLPHLSKSTNNFDPNLVIGKVGFAKVYKGCLQHDDASEYTVAVKRFNNDKIEEFRNEIELLCQLRHPNIISLIGFCNHKDEKIGVYEYMSNGFLDQHLYGGDREALSWKKRLEICIGAARGLHYLHAGAKRTIIHRDIKPHNILLDHNMQPKLAGFSLGIKGAHFMSKPKPIEVHVAGTLGYMAREHFEHCIVTDKCDVYSFGVVLLEVLWGARFVEMHRELMEKPLEENIDQNIKGKIAAECWKVFTDIMVRCLENEPDERPTMGEVEVEFERALSLQEQADLTNTNDSHYALFSATIIRKRSSVDEQNWVGDSGTDQSTVSVDEYVN